MNRSPSPVNRTAKRMRLIFLILVTVVFCLHSAGSAWLQSPGPPVVFEIELPDFSVAPTNRLELTIPSANVNQVFVHVLRPAADNIDYSAIHASVNGKSSAQISEIVSGVRGKLVKINLQRYPGFAFVEGRNIVEIWAENRRGRAYYTSFVLQTATENRNEEFTYQVEHSAAAKNSLPPELVLIEPERAVEFPAGRKNLAVKISGIATTATDLKRVSVDGHGVALKPAPQESTRALGLRKENKQVAFETTLTVNATANHILIEAEDNLGTVTRLTVPVVTGKAEPATQFTGKKYALVVGISKYRNNAQGIPDLEYADVDARSIHQFLQQRDGGQFAASQMLLLTNADATLERIREALADFIGKATADDLLLIFFAGHGAADPAAPQNYYIIANDTSVANMPETALAMSDLRKYIERNVRAKRVVLLVDTCHSAGLSGEITRQLTNNLVNLYLEKLLFQEEGRAIITSSDVNEVSRESAKWGNGHGVFTYYLLEGLRGKADTNDDGLVSVGELFHFVRQKVRVDTEFKQNPRMLAGANENLALSVARRQR